MDAFLTALSAFSDPYLLMVILIGTLGGVLVGAMPGLSSTMSTALLLPFTLTMDPIPAISLLSALYCAGTFGGSITAILVNAPGAPPAEMGAATATVNRRSGHPVCMHGLGAGSRRTIEKPDRPPPIHLLISNFSNFFKLGWF